MFAEGRTIGLPREMAGEKLWVGRSALCCPNRCKSLTLLGEYVLVKGRLKCPRTRMEGRWRPARYAFWRASDDKSARPRDRGPVSLSWPSRIRWHHLAVAHSGRGFFARPHRPDQTYPAETPAARHAGPA